MSTQPRLRILAGSASAGGVRFLDGGNLRCFSKVRCLSEASSDFWKTVLADFQHLRSQPPTKPQTGQYPEPRRPSATTNGQSSIPSRQKHAPSQPFSAALMALQPSNPSKKRGRIPMQPLNIIDIISHSSRYSNQADIRNPLRYLLRSSRNYPCRQSFYKSQT